MDAILLLVSEFTEELIWAQVCLIGFWSALYLYQYLIKRREAINPEWVPAAVVKNYLDRVRDGEAGIRLQLFGEASTPGMAAPVIVQGADPALGREIEALRAQLSTSDQRIQEKEKLIAELRAKGASGGAAPNNAEFESAKAAWTKEKTELEKKIAAAQAAAGGGGTSAEVQKQLDDMKARLQEYEVIEDDLANLKKYQLENKRLQEQLAGAGLSSSASAGTAPARPIAPAPAAAPAPTPAPAVAKPVEAAPVPAPVTPPAPAPAPVAATPVIAVAPAPEALAPESAAVAPAGEKKGGEEDLLSEFEKMLAS